MSEWLELELAHHLAPTRAPGELWKRVEAEAFRRPSPIPLRTRETGRLASLPLAAAITLVLGGALWFAARGQQPRPTLRQFPNATARAESCLLCHTSL